MRSFLVTDFGIAYTRTVLIDEVAGQYRLIAGAQTRTTATAPFSDVTVGLIRSLERLEALTGRKLLGEAGLIRPEQPDGSGFDEFLATASSAGRPLRAVIIGLMDDFSLLSAKRVLTGTYVETVQTLTLVDKQTEEQRINIILKHQPDVLFIVGGTNNGNEENVRYLIRLAELAVRLLPREQRPIVLYAGNERLRNLVRTRFSEHGIVLTADNIRPDLGMEVLGAAKQQLARVFDNFLRGQASGFNDISELSSSDITPTAQSATRVVRYLDTLKPEASAVYLDIGSGTSTFITSYQDVTTTDIRSNLGLGHHVEEILKVLDWRDVERWLPFAFSLEGLEEWAANKALAPLTIPQTLRDLLIEQAVAREIARLMLKDPQQQWKARGWEPPTFMPVIAAGSVFTNIPPRLAALVLLDALEPRGQFDIWLDPYALTAALGSVSYREALALVQVIDNGGFTHLGTFFCPTSKRSTRPRRMDVRLTLSSGKILEHQLSFGELWMPQLPPNIAVEVEIKLTGAVSINGQKRLKQTVKTGLAGLVFDLRGRPLQFGSGRKRRTQLAEWFTHATGITIEEALLGSGEVNLEEVNAMLDQTVASLLVSDFPDYAHLPEGDLAPELAVLLNTPFTIDDDLPIDDLLPNFDEDDPFSTLPDPSRSSTNLDDLRRQLG